MKLQCPMLVVSDLAASRAFYETLLGQKVILDFGANITFNGGFALQTEESWLQFIGKPSSVLKKKPHDMELYFETESFDSFLQQLGTQTVELVHLVQDMPWGQRLIRFYDPDGHIIEVGESMQTVICRFLRQGMSAEEVAQKSQHPIEFVRQCESLLDQ